MVLRMDEGIDKSKDTRRRKLYGLAKGELLILFFLGWGKTKCLPMCIYILGGER